MNTKLHRIFFFAIFAATVAVVVIGFLIVGSPAKSRLRKLDAQRLSDLQDIQRKIHEIVVDTEHPEKLKRPLPRSLEELRDEPWLNVKDPETGELYGYVVKDETTYQLCATFALPRESDEDPFWNHPAGRHCFTFNVRKLK